MRRPRVFRHAEVLGLSALIVAGLAASARAQRTPDPFNIVGDYNARYENWMYPTYPNGLSVSPGDEALMGRSGIFQANKFRNFVEDMDGYGSGMDQRFNPWNPAQGGIEPYYRAHREGDQVFQRPYEPLLAPRAASTNDQKLRTEKYLEYLRESDPKRRAQLYREYQNMSLRAARDLGSGSARAAFRSGTDRTQTPGNSRAVTPSPGTSAAPRTRTRTGTGSATGTGTGTSTAPSPAATTRGGAFRRSTGVPAVTSPSRNGRTTPSAGAGTETPSQVLERAERQGRPARSSTPSGTAPR